LDRASGDHPVRPEADYVPPMLLAAAGITVLVAD